MARVKRGTDSMDIASEWTAPGTVSIFDRQKDQKRFHFLYTEKPLVLSYDSEVDAEDKRLMSELNISALCVLPIQIGNGVAMYSCFMDSKKDKKWRTDEIKFLYDSMKVLQSILTKRIQKNVSFPL